MEAYYEKIGNVIYGSQRLHSALCSLIEWFAAENPGGAREVPAGTIEKSIASAYFESRNSPAKCRAEFNRIADAIVSIERVSHSLNEVDQLKLDGHLAMVRELHFSLAQYFDDIGYSGIPPVLLRQKGNQLRDPGAN